MTDTPRIRLRTPGAEIEVEPGAIPTSAGDLARTLAGASIPGFGGVDAGLWVDGRPYRRSDLVPLEDGATVAPWHAPRPRWVVLEPAVPGDPGVQAVPAGGGAWRIGAHPTGRLDGVPLRRPMSARPGAVLVVDGGAWLLDRPPAPRRVGGPRSDRERRWWDLPWTMVVAPVLTAILAALWFGPVGLAFGAVGLVSVLAHAWPRRPRSDEVEKDAGPGDVDPFRGADVEGRPVFGRGDPGGAADARWHLPTATAPPVTATLGHVLAGPASVATVRRRRGPSGAMSVPVPVLVDPDGRPIHLDLVGDGPHALVVGTTGSGKSELLRTWLVAVAVHHDVSELGLVLIDFKGGSAFDDLAALPHVRGMVTDLDGHEVERALASLEVEIRHRETVLRAGGERDVTRSALGRIVVAVDEFSVLADAEPGQLDRFVDIARRGRSLGIHLILAAQRPGAALRPDLVGNVGLRIALRVQDVEDSRAVVGVSDAADLPAVPGAAVVAVAGRRATGRVVRSDLATPDRTVVAGGSNDRATAKDDLARWIEACVDAHTGPAPEPVVAPPLPDRPPPGCVIVVDDLVRRRSEAVASTDMGHLGIVGPPVRTSPVALGFAARWDGEVAVIARRPPTPLRRAVIDPDDVWAIERLAHRLETDRRRWLVMLLEPRRLLEDDALATAVDRLLRDGSASHRLVVAAEREAAIPGAVAALLDRLVHLDRGPKEGRGVDRQGRRVQLAVAEGPVEVRADRALPRCGPEPGTMGLAHPDGRVLGLPPVRRRPFVVCGGQGSGRTTLLHRIAAGLATRGPVGWVGDAPTPPHARAFPDVGTAADSGLVRIVVDDADHRWQGPLPPPGWSPPRGWIMGIDPSAVGYTHPLAELRGGRFGVVLAPMDDHDAEFLGLRLTDVRRRRFRPGDGAFADGAWRWFHRIEERSARPAYPADRHADRQVPLQTGHGRGV